MKWTFLILLLCACTNNPDQNIEREIKATMEEHTVVFYNTENLFDTQNDPLNDGDEEFTPEGYKNWDDEKYQTKLNHLADAIYSSNDCTPTFIGLVEIENRKVLEDLSTTGNLNASNYKIVHYDSEDRRGIDCGLLYNADYFNVLDSEILSVRLANNSRFRTRDILYVYGTFKNGQNIHLFVNHWSSRREGQEETEPRRIRAAEVLREKIDQLLSADEKANILVMGDFNDTPSDKSLYSVLRAKGQHEVSNGDLINLFIEEEKDGKGTSVHQREWDLLDQLIVSKGLLNGSNGISIKENNAFIVFNEELIYTYKDGGQKPASTYGGDNYYGGYSDHLPVYTVLKVK